MKKKFRLTRNEDFAKLISNKKFFTNNGFSVYYIKNSLDYSRIGISVGKKHGNAVVRNKIKRQIRMMAMQAFDFDLSYDYVVMIKKGYHQNSFNENLKLLIELVDKIKKRGV